MLKAHYYVFKFRESLVGVDNNIMVCWCGSHTCYMVGNFVLVWLVWCNWFATAWSCMVARPLCGVRMSNECFYCLCRMLCLIEALVCACHVSTLFLVAIASRLLFAR